MLPPSAHTEPLVAKPISVVVFDTKPYDQEWLKKASATKPIHWRFFEFRLEPDTAASAKGADVACIFVNDNANRESLQILAQAGIRHIAMRCAGFNNLDVEAARQLGILVTRVPNYSPNSVAEHTVALLLTLNRKIHRAYNRVRELNFSLNGLMGFDLCGKTAGIIGTGKIGRIVAQILRGFQMNILAHDPYPNPEWANSLPCRYCSLDELVRNSDIISLHLPLQPDTYHIINKDLLELCKPGAYLINVSRGKLIDSVALIEALKSGRIGGVALDVYEEEENIFFRDLSQEGLQDDILARLLTFPNVLITAHQAFLTSEALSDISYVTVENILRFAKNQAPLDGTVVAQP